MSTSTFVGAHLSEGSRSDIAPWEVGLLEELARHLEPRDRLKAIGELLPRILGMRLFSVFVLNREETRFVPLLHNHRGIPAELAVPVSPGSVMTQVVHAGRSVLVDAFPASAYATAGEWKGKYHAPGALCLPLEAEGRIVGVLNLNDPREGFTPAWIERAVKLSRHLSRVLDLARRLNAVEEWQELDPVTGLHPKGFFTECLRAEVARARRLRVPVSCIVVNVVQFGLINTEHGATVGDTVLHHVAYLVREQCRRADVAARYEGASFVLLLPGAQKAAAQEVADRIRRKVDLDAGVPGKRSRLVRVAVRVGVAECPADADTAHRLLRKAEEAVAVEKRAIGGSGDRVIG